MKTEATPANVGSNDGLGPVDAAVIACWKTNYGLDRTPHDLYAYWQPESLPTGAVLALKAAVHEIERLSSERDVQEAAIACLRTDLRECATVRDADIDRHADALHCALEALDYCIEDSAELLSERTAQWGQHRKDRQAAMAATIERHRAVAERLRAMLRA